MYSSEEDKDFSDLSDQDFEISGPYNIEPSKPYKPVFIVFLDMIYTITFVMVSLMYYWVNIPNDHVKLDWSMFGDFFTFIPGNVYIMWLVLACKNLGNTAFLACKYGKDKANRSIVTTNLFLFRVYYDVLIIGGSLMIINIFPDCTKTQTTGCIRPQVVPDCTKPH